MRETIYHHIKIQQFEGPLDLLLQLIEAKELEITNISLVEVTDQYISYLTEIEETRPEQLVNFLVIASRLILIKSRALLPILEPDGGTEEDVEDLARRLESYRVIKLLAKGIHELDTRKNISFSRLVDKIIRPVFFPPRNATPRVFHKFFDKIFQELFREPQILPQKELKELIKLEDKIQELKNRIVNGEVGSFSGFLRENTSRLEVIISFLAMLHLLKGKVIIVEQTEMFGEIAISKC